MASGVGQWDKNQTAILKMVRVMFMWTDQGTQVSFDAVDHATVVWTSPVSGRAFTFNVTVQPEERCGRKVYGPCRTFEIASLSKGLKFAIHRAGCTWRVYLDSLYYYKAATKNDPTLNEITPLLQSASQIRLFDASTRRRNDLPTTPLHVVTGSVGTYGPLLGARAYDRRTRSIARAFDGKQFPQIPVRSDQFTADDQLAELKNRFARIQRTTWFSSKEVAKLHALSRASTIEEMANILGHYKSRASEWRTAKMHPDNPIVTRSKGVHSRAYRMMTTPEPPAPPSLSVPPNEPPPPEPVLL